VQRTGQDTAALVGPFETGPVLIEVRRILALLHPDSETSFFNELAGDTITLYGGKYPGYRENNAAYHNLDHTLAVALAAARMLHGAALCGELAKLGHASQGEANKLFTLFRVWLSRQFALLGRAADADALAMHLLARSQGVATLASAFHDETFIRQEVRQMDDWLESCAESTAPAE
jgi:hypothetical protein